MAREEGKGYLMGAVEALLFVSDEPVSAARLAKVLESDTAQVEEVLLALEQEYGQEDRGMQLREVAGGWRFYSHPAYHEVIEKYMLSWDTRKLSEAALETLAVIAYHQPVTRATINGIRGVSSDGVISSLVEKGLVKEQGRDKSAGNAILYGTTRTFLEKFGLKSTKELPPLEDFAPDEATREFIRERLGGMRKQAEELELEMETAEDAEEALQVLLLDEEGKPVSPEEVDRGEEERVDDPQAMAAILDASLTEKVQ